MHPKDERECTNKTRKRKKEREGGSSQIKRMELRRGIMKS